MGAGVNSRRGHRPRLQPIKTGQRKGRAFLKGAAGSLGGVSPDQPARALRSSSGVVMGVRPNFSTRTLRTVGETKAGRDGPMADYTS